MSIEISDDDDGDDHKHEKDTEEEKGDVLKLEIGVNNTRANKKQEHESSVYDNLTLLNIMLCKPVEFEHKDKPSAIRKEFFCTLNSEKVSVTSCLSDDNGAYNRTSQVKSAFM